MGFSFKKVFSRSEGRAQGVLEVEEQAQTRAEGAVSSDLEESSRSLGEGVPSLPPPPLEGDFVSPFDSPDLAASPFEDTSALPSNGGGLEPSPGAGLPAPARELTGFEVQPSVPVPEQITAPVETAASPFDLPGMSAEAPASVDPAAAPLPTKYDDESARDLESKGFRPLSSLPNPGEAQLATASNDQPMQDLPNPQRPVQPADGGLQSPFEVAGSRETPFANEQVPPQQPVQPAPPAQSPFEVAPPAQPPQQPASPFEQAAVPPAPASPFEQVPAGAPAPVPSGPIPAPIDPGQMPGSDAAVHSQPQPEDIVAELPPGALEDTREFVEMNLVQLLSSVSPAELGIAELAVSPFAKTRIPMAMLRPQLPTGQVFLNVSDLIVGCTPEHRASMVGCNPTVRLPVPIALIFPTAGAATDVPAAAAAPVAEQAAPPAPDPFGAPAVTPDPFASGAASLPPAPAGGLPPAESPLGQEVAAESGIALPGLDSGSTLPPAEKPPLFPPAAEQEVAAPEPVVPAEPVAPSEPAIPAAPAEPADEGSTFGSPLSALAPLGGGIVAAGAAAAAAAGMSSPQVEEEEAAPLPPMMPAGGGLEPTSFDAPAAPPVSTEPAGPPEPVAEAAPSQPLGAGGWPFDGAENAAPTVEDEVESLEDLPAVDEAGALIPVAGFEGGTPAAKDAQSPLRALFLKDGAIDADAVVAHFEDLPGIENCVVLGDDAKLVSSSSDFAKQAATLHANLAALTSAAGVAASDRFSIRTDSALVTFFSGKGFALGVKHDLEGFRPGVNERLELVAQNLGTLS